MTYAVYMCGRKNKEPVKRQLSSYQLLERQLLANCSNRAAAATEDTGVRVTMSVQTSVVEPDPDPAKYERK